MGEVVAARLEYAFSGPVSLLLRFLKWFSDLSLTIVATSLLLAGLVISSTDAAGWNDQGYHGLLLAD